MSELFWAIHFEEVCHDDGHGTPWRQRADLNRDDQDNKRNYSSSFASSDRLPQSRPPTVENSGVTEVPSPRADNDLLNSSDLFPPRFRLSFNSVFLSGRLPTSVQDPTHQTFALAPRADLKMNAISPEAGPAVAVADILRK